MEIRILPGNIANMIAAGEVVQRPASVVKELMENAVDAGATQVMVIVTDAGRTLIQVIDNGVGMTPDQAVLSFERHATSKIATAEDLNDIETYGFRGEALASIAAVAEVTLKTRPEGQEVGCQVDFAASKQTGTSETSCPIGSNFAVRNLFFNVPARRKFLKSDNVELRHIIEEFTRVALTHPEIAFTLKSNGRDIYVLQKAKSLKFRIHDLMGDSASSEVFDIGTETDVVKIHGYVGLPEKSRKTLGNQFFFVNGRYFRSPYFHKAVMKAYEDMIPDGATPSYFIYLSVNPHDIDVNIHPTKTEVKFQDDTVIFQVLYACVREALGKNTLGAQFDFDRGSVPEMPVFGNDFEKYRPETSTPGTGADPDYNPFDTMPGGSKYGGTPGAGFPGLGFAATDAGAIFPDSDAASDAASGLPGAGHEPGRGTDFGYSASVDKRQDYGKLFEEKTLPASQVIIFRGKYILTQVSSGLLAVDVTRARERIFYDRFLALQEKRGHVSQTALFPVRVTVGAANRLIFTEHAETLSSLGFEISPDGTDTIVVSGVPEGYGVSQQKVEAAMADLLVAMNENSSGLPGMVESKVALKAASIGARSSDPLTSPLQAQRLVDLLFSSSNPEFTPSGKKITAIITAEEIEKKLQ